MAWDATEEALYGLERDRSRLVEIDPEVFTGVELDGPRRDAISGYINFEDTAGENLAVDSRTPGKIYVPQPGKSQVKVFTAGDLSNVGEFGVGVAPARVALDAYSDVLFLLSKEGSHISRVDLTSNEIVAETRVDGGPITLIETSGDGSGTLWAAGPSGVTLYGGPSLSSVGSTPFEAGSLTVAEGEPDRAYAGQENGDRVVALEPAGEIGWRSLPRPRSGGESLPSLRTTDASTRRPGTPWLCCVPKISRRSRP